MIGFRTCIILVSILSLFLSATLSWSAPPKAGTTPAETSKTEASAQPPKSGPAPGTSLPPGPSSSPGQPSPAPATPPNKPLMPPTRSEMAEHMTAPERRLPRPFPAGLGGPTTMEVKDFDADGKPDIVILRGSQLLVIGNKGNVIMNMVLPEPPAPAQIAAPPTAPTGAHTGVPAPSPATPRTNPSGAPSGK